MEVQVAVAKVDRYAAINGGDTVEVIERPNGGVSIVLADGKLNGVNSKAISMKVVHRTIGLISESIQDGAAAKAVAKILYKENAGQASASLNILSCDLQSNTIVITRCNPVPVMIIQGGNINCLSSDCTLLGDNEDIKSSIYQIPLEGDITIVLFTDGIFNAGQSEGITIDLCTTLNALFQEQDPTAQETADFLLSQAINLDQNQPEDDMCVVVMQTIPQLNNPARRLSFRFPVI